MKIGPSIIAVAILVSSFAINMAASERRKDALEAFTRAKSAGNLAPDLLAFVEQRLRQLQ